MIKIKKTDKNITSIVIIIMILILIGVIISLLLGKTALIQETQTNKVPVDEEKVYQEEKVQEENQNKNQDESQEENHNKDQDESQKENQNKDQDESQEENHNKNQEDPVSGDTIENDNKLIKISKAIKGKIKSELIGYEDYVGNFIKIGQTTLKQIGLDYEGEYYVNIKTGEVYDIVGEELNGITYNTINEYNQIINSSDIEKTKELMQIKRKAIKEINNLQLENGSYATYGKVDGKESFIVPYFDCIGLIGLIDDIASLYNIRKYIQWHFNHINLTKDVDGIVGTIYDYKVATDGTEIFNEEHLYDSIDSYSSMFFVMLENYYNKTGDQAIFQNNLNKLEKVEQALNTMFNYNGSNVNLTLTKPQYPVYYLIDNCESYAAYNSLANIYEKVYSNSDKSQLYKRRAQLIKEAIEKSLWNEKTISKEFYNYDYAYNNSSITGLFLERSYYPYVLAQIYPVLYNIVDIDTEKSQYLYSLHKYYSDWSNDGQHFWYTFNHNDDKYPHFESLFVSLMYDNTKFDTKFYNIDIEYDIEQAINIIRSNYRENRFKYYLNISERGYMIRALNMYMNKFVN